ncbi:ABC transporter ATP-binding protein [Cohnella sp. GCM10027633]|uniref:ABC transporter ATP-binding protein n=1 Tax=unclassified Cohnella TaxID=2636738 RepID=UPI0036362861
MQSVRLFRRLLPHVRIRWRLTLLAYACVFLNLTFQLLQPYVFLLLIDKVLIGGEDDWLTPLLAASGGLALGSAALGSVQAGLFRYLGIRHTLDVRETILARLRRIPMTEIERQGAGKYSALMGMDTATMGNFLNHVVMELASQWYSLLFALSVIFYIDWQLGIAALAFVPVLLAIPRLYRGAIARNTGFVRTHNEEIGTHLFESIEGSREIRVHGLEQWENRRNERMYRNLVRASVKDTLYRVLSGHSGALAVSAIVLLLYGVGSGRVLDGTMTIGTLVALVQYFNNALAPVQAMNHFVGELQAAEVAMRRIEEFLNTPEEPISGAEGPVRGEESFHPTIEAEGLHSTYGEQEILRDIGFRAQAGMTAAFVGRSGSGKSTLFRVILGFMPLTAGTIRLGGIRNAEWTRDFLTRRVGVVFQESFLFAGTIRDNIALGRLDASDEEIYEAAERADLRTLIDALPDGMHTEVGHRGSLLSGGQRQKVAIARAILQRPDILILDEPTSALDRASEERVLRALARLMDGKLTLISTHRLATVENADAIYVMEQGRIVDRGRHRELVDRGATAYLDMLARQQRSDEVHAAPHPVESRQVPV